MVQKLIETLKTKQQISLVISALESGFLALIKDLNGNHVIQRCLQCFPGEDSKVIAHLNPHCMVSCCLSLVSHFLHVTCHFLDITFGLIRSILLRIISCRLLAKSVSVISFICMHFWSLHLLKLPSQRFSLVVTLCFPFDVQEFFVVGNSISSHSISDPLSL